ncbi:MAG: NADH-quinone oxidoreductase subunit H [Chitinophagaceae bacterium]|nr:NADH-quinone oxidoreductase subunit H [Chitinophagaceae bacterium]
MVVFLLIFVSALVFSGIIARTKAYLSGRCGASIFQPFYDIMRLFKKGSIFSSSSSFLMQIGSVVYFVSILIGSLVVPVCHFNGILSFEGDFIFFAYMFSLGRFFMVLSGLDVSSGFEGMGVNREVLYSLFVEPVFFTLLASLCMFTGHTSFASLFQELHFGSDFSFMIAFLSVYILASITLVETSRLPVDDPNTHLELTMVHEVIILDHSGFDLALVQLGTALKMSIFGTFIANCILPGDLQGILAIFLFLCIQVLFAVGIGIYESFRARNKMIKNSIFLISLFCFSIILLFVIIIINNKI